MPNPLIGESISIRTAEYRLVVELIADGALKLPDDGSPGD
jgi:hypothetical protein